MTVSQQTVSTSVPLSDLVLLQMMGEIDTYTDDLLETGDGTDVIDEAWDAAAVDEVFDEIVRKSVESQFEAKYTFVRELAQNAKDAYPADATDRPVTFELEHRYDETVLTARDHGAGMRPDELIQDLLVPYRSGKHLDPETIGEHGIGWYSVLAPADEVTVTTGRDGMTTTATIEETVDGWTAHLDTEPGAYDGTEITVSTNRGNFDRDAIWDELRKHVGRVDPDTATITFDNDQVNTIPDDYELGATRDVDGKHGISTLELYYRHGDTRNPNLPITQDGLYISRPYAPNQIDSDNEVQQRIFEDLIDNGYQFWVDIPHTVGLTKGRNQIVAEDRDAVYDAITPAFEDFVIDRLLEDDGYMKEIDTKAADWVNELLAEEYLEKRVMNALPANVGKAVKRGAMGIAALPLIPVAAAHYVATDPMARKKIKDVFTFSSDTADDVDSPEIDTEIGSGFSFDPMALLDEIGKKYQKFRYYSQMSGFSERVMNKDCIDAVQVDVEPEHTKVSIRDMIDAHIDGELYTLNQAPYDDPGLYVDRENRIARQVYDRFETMDRAVEQHTEFDLDADSDIDLEEIKARIRRDINDLKQLPAYIRSAADNDIDLHDIGRGFKGIGRELWEFTKFTYDQATPDRPQHVSYDTVHQLMEEEDTAHAYHDLLLTASYIDDLIAEANGLDPAAVMGHTGSYGEIAHTDHVSISLNLASPEQQQLLDQFAEGYVDQDAFNSLAHTIIHEKAHRVHGSMHETADHGSEFYDILRDIEEGYTVYTTANGIDPQDDINGYLAEQDRGAGGRLSLNEFADQVGDYRSPL